MAPYVVLSWLAGRLADRFARGLMVKASLLLRLVLLTATAWTLSSGHVTTAVLCAALAVACGTPAYPALAAEMPSLAGVANESATGLLVTLEVAAFFVGPAVGGIALSLNVPLASCWMSVVLTGVALSCVLGIPWIRQARPRVVAGGTAEDVGVIQVLLRQRVALSALVAVVINNAVLGAVGIALLPLANDAWDGSSREFGIATAALGVGAFAAPALLKLWGIDGLAGRRSAVLLAGFLAGTLLSPQLLWAFLPLAVAGAAAVHVEAVATALIQHAAPDRARSSVLGLADSLMVAAGAIGAAVTPWLAAQSSARTVMAACAAASLGMLTLFPPGGRLVPGSSRRDLVQPGGLAS
jgi:MFS family permease